MVLRRLQVGVHRYAHLWIRTQICTPTLIALNLPWPRDVSLHCRGLRYPL